MIIFEDTIAILDNYEGSISRLFNEDTILDNKIVHKWVVGAANLKPRKLEGLGEE